MENLFNWENIYASENATILEMLLDKKVVAFDELIALFFPNDAEKLDSYSYLINLIRPWEWLNSLWGIVVCDIFSLKLPLYCFDETYFYLWLCTMVQHYYIPNFGEATPQVYTDKILALMIREGILPVEICRLPRLNKETTSIVDYYETLLDYNTASTAEIANHPANNAPNPISLTYLEAIKRLEKNECPASLIAVYARQEKHPVYIQAADESIRNCNQMKQFSKQSIDYYREANSGNPYYTKRYHGLERLTQHTVEALFDGTTINIKNDALQGLKVQTTDIETKYHIERYIKSCIQVDERGGNKSSNIFQMHDTLHLDKDIDALILDYHAPKTLPSDYPPSIEVQAEAQPIESITTPPKKETIEVVQNKEPKQKRCRSKQHPLFNEYAKIHSSSGSFGDYLKMMHDEQYVFQSKADYLTKANEDNSDNTQDSIKRVALVRGTSKHGNPKYDIYYKPVRHNGESLGKAKSIAARTAETYFT